MTYMPTTDEVRSCYEGEEFDWGERGKEFDRWLAATLLAMPLWLVTSRCYCQDEGCEGSTSPMLFASEQTACQEAAERYPLGQVERIRIDTKVRGW